VIFSINDVVEVKLYAHSEGQYSVNTLHYKVTAAAGGGSTDEIFAGELSDMFPDRLKAAMSVQATYEGLTVQIIRPTRRPRVINIVGRDVGGVAGDILPRQVAGLIQKRTTTASRSGRGRMFVPFPSETHNNPDGFPVIAYTDLLDLLATTMLTTVVSADGANTSTLVPCLYNRNTHATILLTGAISGSTWGTCRRRADVRGADKLPF